MEAVPKLPLLSFELKTSPENTHFGPKLKQYIAEAYREDPASYSNEIHQLEGLRSAAVRPSVDASGLSALIRYFCQLRAIQSRFPMAKGQPVACSFTWRDLYANMTCTLADIRFDLACIVYNIGALLTQLAAFEPRTTADSLKAACSKYQNAAWAFQFLREQYPQPPAMDVNTEIMRLLQEICFAQAQECILDKSIQDTRKPSVIGAVAVQVMSFYKHSLALLGPSTGTDNIHEVIGTKLYNYWYRFISFKIAYIGTVVCLYQGMNAEEQQKMGERVAYYQQAAEKLSEARKLSKYIEPVQVTQEALTFINDVVEGKKKAAKNENEFIYHEEVPDKDLLIDLKPACLVKAIPINLNDPELSGTDIFSRLVPMVAHEASSLYSEEKAKLLRQVVSQVESKETELMEFMSSLQLDQLEVLDSDQKIPQEIVDRCAAMNAKTEVIQTLVDSMNNLAEIITDVEHSLTEIKSLIQEETFKEKEYQKLMGPRPPSIVQTELSREFHKYQEAHARTNESNQVLHKAMTLHIANLRLLSQPLDVLQAKIPSIDNIEGLDLETMAEMRRVVGKAREMQNQRTVLLQQLREAVTADDITAKLLSRNPEHADDDIFKEELEKHTPQVKIIEQNLAAQENIINKLTSLYASYGESRRLLSDVLRKREGLVNALITSYDTYEELLGKSQKGQEFYKKLSHNISQLLTRMRSTCQVQEEERAQMLATNVSKASVPQPSTPSKTIDSAPQPSSGGGRKLKDYLPYMKNRNAPRSVTPQAQEMPVEYYSESMYPTSVRPTPLGSEATDISQMKVPDGVVPGMQYPNTYNRYNTPYAPTDPDAYSNYNYGVPAKTGYQKPEEANYGYSTPYTPAQYSSHAADPQIYSNPYYSATHNNLTAVTDSPNPQYNANVNPSTSQYNPYTDQYVPTQLPSVPETAPPMPSYNPNQNPNSNDLNVNFSQMQISYPKQEIPDVNYSQTFYSVQYPQAATPNMATYSHAPQNSTTNMTQSQLPVDYSSLNYPYSNDPSQYPQQTQPVNPEVPYSGTEYSYPNSEYNNMPQAYPIYTNTDSLATCTTNASDVPVVSQQYSYPVETNTNTTSVLNNPNLSQLDDFDKPIKSHVTGEALSTNFQNPYQNYEQATVQNYNNATDPNYPTNNSFQYPNQTPTVSYEQNYQNHPGYTYNVGTGGYDYNYGSQNSYSNYGNVEQANVEKPDQNWAAHGVYTSAGICQTVQSPSEVPQNTLPQASNEPNSNDQTYYNAPYGYQTVQPNETQPADSEASTNYGANMNQSTYMQSGQSHQSGNDTSVTYTKNQVSSPKEEIQQPNFEEVQSNQTVAVSVPIESVPVKVEKPVEAKEEEKPEPSVFDLLSEIDFSVEQKPLMPEIKVPAISESAIVKPAVVPKPAPVSKPVVKEEVIERPAKVDLFSDPMMLNSFTKEMKSLQNVVDSLSNLADSGDLDAKWKSFLAEQDNNNMSRSKSIAIRHGKGNKPTDIVPYDDSRVALKSDPNAYINASYYKQLGSWCIPLVISNSPSEHEYSVFWRAVLENRISCVVCLLSEIEMQGNTYWPTAIGQCVEFEGGARVTLDDVKGNVHWTERKLTVACGIAVAYVTHYQISVYPAKIVCPPLVLLTDRILQQTYENRLSNQLTGAWLQCGKGGGRCSVLALLILATCQLRAGQPLKDVLDVGCVNLYKQRTNVLEEKKYLVDAYKTVMFYVQGVFCSGSTMFNGEAVSVPSGASVLPPVTPNPSSSQAPMASSSNKSLKFSRESFEEMKQAPGLKSGDMKDPLNFLDPLWSLKKK